MGLFDFLFGKKKKKKEDDDKARKAETERIKAEQEKAQVEAQLRQREAQLKSIEDQMKKQSQEQKKTQEQLQNLLKQQNNLQGAEAQDHDKIEQLERKLQEKEMEIKQQQLKQTMELYTKQSQMEEDIHKKQHEVEALLGKLKEEEQTREEGEVYKSAEIVRLEEQLKKKEEELRKKEEEIESRELDGWMSSIDDIEDEDGSAPTGAHAHLEELKKKEQEFKELEAKLAAEMEKILELRAQRRNEFRATLGSLTFENFVVGPSNRFPFEVCQSVAKTPAEAYNPLYIYGGVGLGKTHLLSAIGNYIMALDGDAVVTYISSETFTNELIHAVEEAQLEEFRERYRSVDVLLVDDIQFIGKQETTQEEFFHTFNSLYNANKQIIIASDRPPKDIPTLEKRLRSRFEGGLITDIKPPDQGTRALILKKKAEKDHITIPADVLTLLATNIRSNIRTLIGALNKVSAYANLAQKELTSEMAKVVLEDVLEEESKLAEADVPTLPAAPTSKPPPTVAPPAGPPTTPVSTPTTTSNHASSPPPTTAAKGEN